jgi:histidine triad (HIT) family protein
MLLTIAYHIGGMNCIFCKIINGCISARIITQNDKAIAFLDAFPLSLGHTLIIPKSHYYKIQDMDKEHLSAVFDLLWKLSTAIEKAVESNASTIAIHNGKDAGQEVPHVHVHIIPRTADDGAGPVHSMFKNRAKISSRELDFTLNNIKKWIDNYHY